MTCKRRRKTRRHRYNTDNTTKLLHQTTKGIIGVTALNITATALKDLT